MKRYITFTLLIFLGLALSTFSFCQSNNRKFEELERFNAKEARQGIAVDNKYVYVIGTRAIGKYDKKTHKLIKHWQGEKGGSIIHLDSGVILDGKLYCAHSNYPGVPMTSSVEIWDAATLTHISSHSFGIYRGSCTWVDRHDGFWWVVFSNYEKWKVKTGKGSLWTSLVKFDGDWRELESWVFPSEVIDQFKPMSNSGGSWGPDGFLYCTGHDNPQLYVFQLPQIGSVLKLMEIVPINILGQGIAWDRTNPGIIYGIGKNKRQVVVSKINFLF